MAIDKGKEVYFRDTDSRHYSNTFRGYSYSRPQVVQVASQAYHQYGNQDDLDKCHQSVRRSVKASKVNLIHFESRKAWN